MSFVSTVNAEVVKRYYNTGELMLAGSTEYGFCRGYHKNGQLAVEGFFKDHLPYDGIYRTWNEDGDLIVERTYKNGELFDENGKPINGIVATYDPVRKITDKTNYVDGILNGVSKTYDENGNLIAEMHFNDGKLHGPMIAYHANGKISGISNWEHGTINGASKKYDEKGNLINEAFFKNGELIK
jgi:antitoxin component YwqK of YwqJK toxin-antitoxin module